MASIRDGVTSFTEVLDALRHGAIAGFYKTDAGVPEDKIAFSYYHEGELRRLNNVPHDIHADDQNWPWRIVRPIAIPILRSADGSIYFEMSGMGHFLPSYMNNRDAINGYIYGYLHNFQGKEIKFTILRPRHNGESAFLVQGNQLLTYLVYQSMVNQSKTEVEDCANID